MDSGCSWWQAVIGLIIRCPNLNPTCYIIHITHDQETDERSHAHGKEENNIFHHVYMYYCLGLLSAAFISEVSLDLNTQLFSVCISQALLVVAYGTSFKQFKRSNVN